MKLTFLFSFILFYGLFSCDSTPEKNDIPLFTNGQCAYACYRIPAIVNSPNASPMILDNMKSMTEIVKAKVHYLDYFNTQNDGEYALSLIHI